MTELLVNPYQQENEPLVNQYYSLLSLFPNLEKRSMPGTPLKVSDPRNS